MQSVPKFPTLYQKTASGKIYKWRIEVIVDKNGTATIVTEYGQVDGKMITNEKQITKGKNIGKKSETTPLTQAIADAKSKFKSKVKEGYVESLEESKENVIVSPMLAGKYTCKDFEKRLKKDPSLEFVCQIKYDGWRCIACKNSDGVIVMKTRGNTDYDITNFPHIVEELKDLPQDVYLDGEIYSDLIDFSNYGLLKKKNIDKEKFKKLKYFVYDSFVLGKEEPFSVRYERLEKVVGGKENIVIVKNIGVKTCDDVKEAFSSFVAEGYEGAIIRVWNKGSYELNKRSKFLLKYKEFDEDEFVISGFTQGQGKEKGLIIYTCVTKNGGKEREFNVRPRSSYEDRAKAYQNALKDPKSVVGKKLTVIYFGLHEDTFIPRMPVGKSIREDI